MSKKGIKLGDEVEDVVSKIRGIAIGHVFYLDGTEWWIIQMPVGEDDKKPVEHYAPVNYCRRTGDGVYPKPKPPVGFHVQDDGA